MSLSGLVRPQPIGGTSLVRDYLRERSAAVSFYGGSPFRLKSFQSKLDDVQRRFGRTERERAAATLHPSSEAARARLERFIEQGGAMVTTGQQAGYLTGPLYTIYKALSAAALARHLEERLGVVVLPIFWVASDDHDWAEVNHAILLDPRGRIRRFTLPEGDSRPLPMSDRALVGDLDSLCDEIVQYVGVQSTNSNLIRSILDPYRVPGRTVGAAFGEAISRLLAPFDLLYADAGNLALKVVSRPILTQALVSAETHEHELRARSEALVGAGYSPQVTVLERGTNVFIHRESGRERLYRQGEGFAVRERREILEQERVLQCVKESPGRFSPNVLLRPVVESGVFPTLAYVAGPGEIGYFAQVGALFAAYGVAPPVVVPRFSGKVMEPGVERVLKKLDLTELDLKESRDALQDRLARREIPPSVAAALSRIREDLAEGFEGLVVEAEEIDETLRGALGATRNRALVEARRAERKILRALKRRELASFAQLDRVLDSLRPYGALQDRVLNALPFLARYGEHFLTEANRAIEEHWRLPE